MASRFVIPQADVGNGISPADGSQLFFFATGTSNLQNTFSDEAAQIKNANPVIADGDGVFPDIWLVGTYKVVLQDKKGTQTGFGEADPVNELANVKDTAFAKNFATLAAAVADKNLVVGDALNIAERTTGNGGGAMWDVVLSSGVTENTFNIVQGTGVGTLSLDLRIEDIIDFKEFGGVGDDSTDNTAALSAFRDEIVSRGIMGFIPKGIYRYTASPDWWVQGLNLEGDGSENTVLKYSGSTNAMNIATPSAGQGFKYAIKMKGFRVDCGASALDGMDIANVAHSEFTDILTLNGSDGVIVHWNLQLAVLNKFNSCGGTVNRFSPSTFPAEVIRLNVSVDGANSTANTFTNPIAEGATVAGIRLLAADNNTFIGGTSESNTGRGVNISPNVCRDNTFIGLDMESNTVNDFDDAGDSTTWDNCLATSSSGSVISASSRLCKVRGGLYDSLTIGSGAKGAVVEDLFVNTSGSGGLTINESTTTYRNIFDRTAGTFVHNVLDRIGLTVPSSPFTHTNNSEFYQSIAMNGGTFSKATIDRGGNTFDVPFATPSYTLLAPGDAVTYVFSASPTLAFALPQNEMKG